MTDKRHWILCCATQHVVSIGTCRQSLNLSRGSSILIEIISDLRHRQVLYRHFPVIQDFLKEIPAVDLRIVSQLRSVKLFYA